MAKIGRNEPCPCGSGKKYKHCHGPIDAEREGEQRKLRKAQDTLLPKLFDEAQTPQLASFMPGALERFWAGKYQVSDLSELEDQEDRGPDRFLTWFIFDNPLDDGRTLVERLAADPGELELTEHERQLLGEWPTVRLRPYVVTEVKAGYGFGLRNMIDGSEREVEDHAASRRIEVGEVIISHLIPAGERFYVTGAAAHLTSDTYDNLKSYIEMQREAWDKEHPDGTDEDFARDTSYALNHFVMALPREEGEPSKVEEFLTNARMSLRMMGWRLGIGRPSDDDEQEATPASDAPEEQPAADEKPSS